MRESVFTGQFPVSPYRVDSALVGPLIEWPSPLVADVGGK